MTALGLENCYIPMQINVPTMCNCMYCIWKNMCTIGKWVFFNSFCLSTLTNYLAIRNKEGWGNVTSEYRKKKT